MTVVANRKRVSDLRPAKQQSGADVPARAPAHSPRRGMGYTAPGGGPVGWTGPRGGGPVTKTCPPFPDQAPDIPRGVCCFDSSSDDDPCDRVGCANYRWYYVPPIPLSRYYVSPEYRHIFDRFLAASDMQDRLCLLSGGFVCCHDTHHHVTFFYLHEYEAFYKDL